MKKDYNIKSYVAAAMGVIRGLKSECITHRCDTCKFNFDKHCLFDCAPYDYDLHIIEKVITEIMQEEMGGETKC